MVLLALPMFLRSFLSAVCVIEAAGGCMMPAGAVPDLSSCSTRAVVLMLWELVLLSVTSCLTRFEMSSVKLKNGLIVNCNLAECQLVPLGL